jgi:acetoin utilization deacetylase AcuC-like enzyme
MHGKTNYPFVKEKSNLDIALENDTKDYEYLSILKETLPKLIAQEKPDFIYYLCGVDVVETDKLGKLAMTLEGCKERDRFVLETCFNDNIPVMCSMGGGYSKDVNIVVDAHANTFRLAQEIYF